MYRQGDVLLVPVDEPLVKARMRKIRRARGQGVILAAGEATGHHHRVREQSAREYQYGGKRYLSVGKEGATVTHEEHDPIPLPAGMFEIVQQREYEPVIRDNTVFASTRAVYD